MDRRPAARRADSQLGWPAGAAYTLRVGRRGVEPLFTTRLRGIEGLRALAAASVLVAHVWNFSRPDARPFDLGKARYVFPELGHGVTLFFALSGFLLYLPFVAARLRGGARPSFSAYLRNRALRILPAYWVIFLLTAVVFGAAQVRAGDGYTIGRMVDTPRQLFENLLLIQNSDPALMRTGIAPAWSLGVEVVFYLVLPLLVVLGYACAGKATTRRTRLLGLAVPAALLGSVC